MDETYRKFHSGRFGPAGDISIPFDTQIEKTKGVSGSSEKPKKEEEKPSTGTGPDPSSEEAIKGYSGGGY